MHLIIIAVARNAAVEKFSLLYSLRDLVSTSTIIPIPLFIHALPLKMLIYFMSPLVCPNDFFILCESLQVNSYIFFELNQTGFSIKCSISLDFISASNRSINIIMLHVFVDSLMSNEFILSIYLHNRFRLKILVKLPLAIPHKQCANVTCQEHQSR